MINQILELIDFLSNNMLNVDDVVKHVGTIENDQGIPLPIHLKTMLPNVKKASLARYPDSGLPYILKLFIDTKANITPRKLAVVLGEFRISNTDFERNQEIVFYSVKKKGSDVQIVVIAELEWQRINIEDQLIASISFRRDFN